MRKKFIKYLIILILTMSILFIAIMKWIEHDREKEQLISQTSLIEKELKNVSKLVVTEMKYAKVYTYENIKSYGWEFFSSKKKALIVSNAKAQISYDLKELKHQIDPENKTIYITYLPEPELTINPDIHFYHMDNGIVNRFEGSDYNKIKKNIEDNLRKEIVKDDVMKNAQNRLLSELSSIYILSNSLGWKLIYNDQQVNTGQDINRILF